MHTILHIDELAPFQYAAAFTVHPDRHSGPLGPPIELEQAFPDREAAVFTLMDAITDHMEENYGLDESKVTIEER